MRNSTSGDWLYFGFDKTRYNVLEVSKMNYNNCDDKSFITNITRGGRDVFNLTEARPYYFLSGLGYCFEGMKVAVYAQYAPPDPAPLIVRNGCPSQSAGYGIIVMVLALLASSVVVGLKSVKKLLDPKSNTALELVNFVLDIAGRQRPWRTTTISGNHATPFSPCPHLVLDSGNLVVRAGES
ncbi:hypothetical protein OIU78_019236 [Salix suchowensis]|nr:hypothetical protein OIU78_019236 [Salix suchowensis]